jgi:trimeric autotransporter adhesin
MRGSHVDRSPVVLTLLLLSACGGGGSSDGGGGGNNGNGGGNPPPPPIGNLQFGATSLSLDESSGTASFTVTRTGGSAGAVSVTVTSTNGTATAGADFTAVNTTVTFADGDAAAKNVAVPIANDTQAEPDETLSLSLSAPTGGSSLGANATTTVTIRDDDPPSAPAVTIAANTKQFVFDWTGVATATHYTLLEDRGDGAGFTQAGPTHTANETHATLDVVLHLVDWMTVRFRVDACNAHGCTPSSNTAVAATLVTDAIGYFKASNTQRNDRFGQALALSADGHTLAIGAEGEASNATGVNGNQGDDSAADAGAVYVFTRTATGWEQQAYLKASNTRPADHFGNSVALSADGNVLAVGAFREDSNATGVNPAPVTNTAPDAGSVYVFKRDASAWQQQAYVKASNTQSGDQFGIAVALSDDGKTLAVGASGEDSNLTGVNPVGDNFDADSSGAVYLFTLEAGGWAQQAYLKASNTGSGDAFGFAASLSADGNMLAVGARGEDGNGQNQNDDSAGAAGAAYVFQRDGAQQWSQQAYVKPSDPAIGDLFGSALDLSADGSTLAVGAPREDSGATGINGDPLNLGAVDSGAIYVFAQDAMGWVQQAYVKASNTFAVDNFGTAVALSANGDSLAVSAPQELNNATGIGGTQTNRSAHFAGAVYVFTRDDAQAWSQRTYVKASNTGAEDRFGSSLNLSGDGTTLAVGANSEASAATGVDGDQTDNSAQLSGAVYLY